MAVPNKRSLETHAAVHIIAEPVIVELAIAEPGFAVPSLESRMSPHPYGGHRYFA